MAKKVSIVLTCDLHDNEEINAEQTVEFGFDGRRWELDLCRAHLDEFEGQMVRLSGAGREIGRIGAGGGGARAAGGGGGRKRAPAASDQLSTDERAACRAWARQQDQWKGLGDRGRLPTAAVEAWLGAGKPDPRG
jgi:hypothetical protein